MLPSIRELLEETRACDPIAVALVKLSEPIFVLSPTAVLWDPVKLEFKAKAPTATLE